MNYTYTRTARAGHLVLVPTIITTIIIIATIVGMPTRAGAAVERQCHTISSSATEIAAKYGSPMNFFGTSSDPLVTVTCADGGTVTMNVGQSDSNLFIYKYAFHKVDGKWRKVTLTGAQPVGPWFVGTAHALLSNVRTTGEGSVIAYMCQKVQGAWKCGCRDEACTKPYWQVQKYNTTPGVSGIAPDISALSGTQSSAPGVHRLSSYMALPGSALMLSGAGFSKANNEIMFGKVTSLKNVPSPLGTQLTFIVPLTLAPGKYEVTVRADGKLMKGSDVLWVKDANAPTPIITGITPAQGKQGDTFTITGMGFSKVKNDIATTFELLEKVVSKDGTTLTFTYEPYDKPVVFRNMDGTPSHSSQQVHVYVITSGGTSNVGTFTLEM